MVDVEKVSMVAMEIITYAGTAKSSYMEALSLFKRGDYDASAEKMKEDGVTINDQVDIEAFKEASESIYSTYEGWSDDLVEKCQKTLAEIRGE